MIVIGNQKITVEQAREFFKITDSKPRDLIKWLETYKYEEYPCIRQRYMDRFALYSTEKGKEYKSINNNIYFPANINIFEIWNLLRYNNKFFKFKKDLKEFEKKYFSKKP